MLPFEGKLIFCLRMESLQAHVSKCELSQHDPTVHDTAAFTYLQAMSSRDQDLRALLRVVSTHSRHRRAAHWDAGLGSDSGSSYSCTYPVMHSALLPSQCVHWRIATALKLSFY